MTNNLKIAVELLRKENNTFVAVNSENIYSSSHRGVKPLLQYIDDGVSLNGYSVADKVIGKAAAFLYVILSPKEIYAGVISDYALRVLEDNGINITYKKNVSAIQNRTKDGLCPMESSVLETDDVNEALVRIRKKLSELNK